MTFEGSGTGRELKKPIPEIREREGNKKDHSQISGMGRELKKTIPEIREREGNKKIHSHNLGTGIRGIPGTRMKKINERTMTKIFSKYVA